MFENLLGQADAVAQLRRDLGAGELPSSVLFAGPPASGKLTAALEVARVLSCEAAPRGAWSCPCPACARHRILAHPDLLLIGPRSFPEEVAAGLDLLRRSPGKASAFFFIRALRKLQKRFDPPLFEGEEARLAKAAPLLRDLEEGLDLIRPEDLGAEGAGLSPALLKQGEALVALAAKLEALVPDTVPIFQVRAAGAWAHLAPSGHLKTIVIEGADRMLEGSRNALLKVLEEPPASLQFILLSSRRTALMATILSRVRPYPFAARSPADEADVLERVFKLGAEEIGGLRRPRPGFSGGSLEAFLAEGRAFPPAEADRLALAFLGAVLARAAVTSDLDPALASLPELAEDLGYATSREKAAELSSLALADLGQATKDFGAKDGAYASAFTDFLRALTARLSGLLRLPGLGPDGLSRLTSWAAAIEEAKTQAETYNRSPGLLCEGLLYAMAEA